MTTINLGTSACTSSDRCVIGRIVESDGVRLFDAPPCPASEDLARAVSASPRHWVEAVRNSDQPKLVSLLADGLDAPLLTDVSEPAWQGALVDETAWSQFDDGERSEPTPAELDDLAADTILTLLRDPDDLFVDPAVIGAALLCFGVHMGVASGVGPEHARGLAHLAARLDGPVSNLCADLSSLSRQSA